MLEMYIRQEHSPLWIPSYSPDRLWGVFGVYFENNDRIIQSLLYLFVQIDGLTQEKHKSSALTITLYRGVSAKKT